MATRSLNLFKKLDQGLSEYYKDLNEDYFNDKGKGKFLQFVIDEELKEEDIDDELNDYENCGYLEFDPYFPFITELKNNLNEEEKRHKIFELLNNLYSNIIIINDIDTDDRKENNCNLNSFEKQFEILCDEICCILSQKMNDKIALKTMKEFKNIIQDQEYETMDDIKEDILDSDGSCILDQISQNKILSTHQAIINKWIKQSICGKIEMNIKEFEWNIDLLNNEKLMKYTINLLKTECESVFRHPDFDTQINNDNKQQQQPEDVNLCIAKALDIKNQHPILLWLVDTFSRYRLSKHKMNLENNIQPCFDNVVNNYDSNQWFIQDNPFTKYLSKKYVKTSEILKHAMVSLTKRILPVFNLRFEFFPQICDSLSIFAKYTLIFHRFCHQIQVLAQRNYPFLPIQFDVWIIPQCVAERAKKNMLPFLTDCNMFNEEDDEKENNSNFKYKLLGKAASPNSVQNEFWELDKILDLDGYILNKNYWMTEIDSIGLRPSNLQNMWDQQARGTQERYQRFIFIIDRRNPINLKNKTVNGIRYDINKDEKIKNNKIWKDKIYLIKPKVYQILTKQYEIIPEQRLGLSSEYLFPNPMKKEPDPIRMLEAINGYKFGLSFHISMVNQAKSYFYYGPGAVLFNLDDMEWLWPRFFIQVNKLDQVLSQDVKNQIQSFKRNNRYFKDDQFEEFQKQTYDTYE